MAIPLIGAALGGGLGVLNYWDSQRTADANSKYNSEIMKYAPWTGLTGMNVGSMRKDDTRPNFIGQVLGGATTGAMMGSNIADALGGAAGAAGAAAAPAAAQAAAPTMVEGAAMNLNDVANQYDSVLGNNYDVGNLGQTFDPVGGAADSAAAAAGAAGNTLGGSRGLGNHLTDGSGMTGGASSWAPLAQPSAVRAGAVKRGGPRAPKRPRGGRMMNPATGGGGNYSVPPYLQPNGPQNSWDDMLNNPIGFAAQRSGWQGVR